MSTSSIQLTEPEKSFVDVYGKMFALRRSKNFGRIFALILLKAKIPEQGLEQQEIAQIIRNNFNDTISVSTVSRILNKMLVGNYCNYTEEKGKRSKRKYFSSMDFKQLAIERLTNNIKEGEYLMNKLNEIKKEIATDQINDQNSNLVSSIDSLISVYSVILDLYEDFEKNLKSLL
jgi:DNA-binding transcriptional regulator GbsR (MarR family)